MSSPKKFTAKIHRQCSEVPKYMTSQVHANFGVFFALVIPLQFAYWRIVKTKVSWSKKLLGSSPKKIPKNSLLKQLSNTEMFRKFSVAVDGRKKSRGQPPFGCFCKTLVNNGDFNYQPQRVNPGFLNHQQSGSNSLTFQFDQIDGLSAGGG